MSRGPRRSRIVFHTLILVIFFSWIYLQRHTLLYTEDVNDAKDAKDRTPIPDQSGEDHSGEIQSGEDQSGEDQSGKDQFWDAMPAYESERHVQFWQQFQPLLIEYKPDCDSPILTKGSGAGEWRINGSTVSQPRPFFVHANFPKFNPATVFTEQAVNPAFEEDGETYTRAWTIPNETIQALGPDLEKHFWTEIMWTACELENKFHTWTDTRDICGGVRRYWKAIFGPDGDPSV
ncbi:hypothetical protein Egran_05439 [Elaphomyces granulatus]|uniref:Uncharacterized protein n=1 Tax=Elaphomyces granulatus TaxID=519963 RepID=A0A232LRT5_9EURO|nr:hypothetical protein Egran_05439 [Elaphomyces granulatus]